MRSHVFAFRRDRALSLDRPPLVRTRGRAVELLLALFLATIVGAPPARAGVTIHGDTTAVRVEADQASVAEVFSAFAAAFALRYRTSVSVDRVINGTYSGTLAQVVARLLDGYSYVIRNNAEGVEVIVLARRGDPAAVPVRTPEPVRNPATDWRTPLRPPR